MSTPNENEKHEKRRYSEITCGIVDDCYSASFSCFDPNNIIDFFVIAEEYKNFNSCEAASYIGLGIGVPTEFAAIKKSDIAVNLDCNAGKDVFIASQLLAKKKSI